MGYTTKERKKDRKKEIINSFIHLFINKTWGCYEPRLRKIV